MADKKKKQNPIPEEARPEAEPAPEQEAQPAPDQEQAADTPGTEAAPSQEGAETPGTEQLLAEAADKYLRLAAEYDNYRKRTAKEKESIWSEAKAQTVAAFLPVFDNLERALKQETADEAYAKGVQMTMTQLKTVLEKLGVEEIPAQGESFDPNVHNAVMHMEDEALEENTVVEVFQAGFKMGEKVIRHAMVKVAN